MISQFSGKNKFLSNFEYSALEYEGKMWATVEHAYQAAKTLDPDQKEKIRLAKTPGIAKKLGGKVDIRKDWEDIKIGIMTDLVRRKFTTSTFKQKLLLTGSHKLVEGNTWDDTFWGICDGVGENHLGKILMQVREELKEKSNVE